MKTTVLKVARVLAWLVYAWVAIVLVLLLLTFILQLFGANPNAGFVDWVYRSVERAMAPFRGIFESIQLSDQSVLDISVLFAMIVYGIVALLLNLAIEWLTNQLRRAQWADDQQAQAALMTRASRQVVQLAGPTGSSASAVLTPQPWGTTVELSASGLDPAQTYWVWLESRGGGRASAGTFQPPPTGSVRLTLSSTTTLGDADGFGITMLPRAGETASTDVLSTRLQPV
jgi:uncharacterized protein YggT (Ycf19 family)